MGQRDYAAGIPHAALVVTAVVVARVKSLLGLSGPDAGRFLLAVLWR